jgi:hypothetical protein
VTGGNFTLKGAMSDGNVGISAGTFTLATATIGCNLAIEGIPPGTASDSICGTMVLKDLAFDGNGIAVQIGSNAPLICPGDKIGGNFVAGSNTSSVLILRPQGPGWRSSSAWVVSRATTASGSAAGLSTQDRNVTRRAK